MYYVGIQIGAPDTETSVEVVGKGNPHILLWEYKYLLQKRVWRLSKNLQAELSYNPATALLDI